MTRVLTPEQREASRRRASASYWSEHHDEIVAQRREARKHWTPEQKAARRVQQAKYRRAHPEKQKEYQRRYSEKVGRAPQREWAARNRWRVREIRLLKEYGITHAQFEAMLAAQNGLCAVCGQVETYRLPSGSVSPLVIDHDHTTGRVRELLCRACNAAIGLFGDDVERLYQAAEYLKRHG